ncbi:hypothetical protein U9M48_012908 [Paspalum notatum var. saurae]|uniref:Secreted protein n=1 Tax=Paspalum notatum var. saurae TaxID=547442 RepID=A0AAQ3WJ29_PASNO
MIPCCVLRSTLKHAMEVVSLLLPLLSMVWRPWRAPQTIPNAEARLQPYGIVCAAASPPLMSPMSPLPSPNPSYARVTAIEMLVAAAVQTAMLP